MEFSSILVQSILVESTEPGREMKISSKDDQYGVSFDVVVNDNINFQMSEAQMEMVLTAVMCIAFILIFLVLYLIKTR